MFAVANAAEMAVWSTSLYQCCERGKRQTGGLAHEPERPRLGLDVYALLFGGTPLVEA